jgi:hypothetical protein
VWTPPGRGRFRLRILAQGPSGPVGVAKRRVEVRLPRPKPKRPKKDKKRERPITGEVLTGHTERDKVSR